MKRPILNSSRRLPPIFFPMVGVALLWTTAGLIAADAVTVRSLDGAVELGNGLVKARFTPADGGVQQQFLARNGQGEWELVVESFRPAASIPPGANKLYDAKVTPHRYLVNSAVRRAEIAAQSAEEGVVKLTGSVGATPIEQTLRLRRGESWFHTEVRAALTGNPVLLEYVIAAFTFNLNKPPSFVHTPTLKFAGRWPGPAEIQVLGDRCFHSPAVVLQEGGLFAALVPDLTMLNDCRIVSPDARRQMLVARNQFSVPIEADKYTMPSALDLDVMSGLTTKPVFAFGLMDNLIQHHIRYLHPHDGSMVRTLEQGEVRFGFDLFVGAATPANTGYQQVSRHLWRRFGHPVFAGERHLAMPFADYTRTIADVTFKPLAVQPGVAGYRDTGAFLEFELNGQAVGGYRNAAPFWLDVLGNTEFWNNVRDATGMFEWGRQLHDDALCDKARRTINLALAAPQNEHGLFPLIYRAESKVWQLDSYDACRGGNAFITSGHDSATYNIVAMSKTCAHLLQYDQHCEQDPRILAYVRKYAAWLVTQIDTRGATPSYVGKDMQPCATLRYSAQPATSLWFLAELYQATRERAYLTGAEKIAAYLQREVLPRQLWTDLEQYFSCGAKPLDFAGDQRQAQPARGNLSIAWAAEGFAALWRATRKPEYLRSGEQALDYLAFTQCGWDPHFIYTAFPFGGFTVDNADTATFLDARQCEYGSLFAWYGKALGRQDLLERGVAAARASTVLINHPRHQTNDIYKHPNIYPFGLGPENIDHEGHPQSAMRTSPSWGEGSGVFTGLAGIMRELGGAYINVAKHLSVGVDGVTVTRAAGSGATLEIDITGRLNQLKQPWDKDYEITLRVEGLPNQPDFRLALNHAPPVAVTAAELRQFPLIVKPDGTVVIKSPRPQ